MDSNLIPILQTLNAQLSGLLSDSSWWSWVYSKSWITFDYFNYYPQRTLVGHEIYYWANKQLPDFVPCTMVHCFWKYWDFADLVDAFPDIDFHRFKLVWDLNWLVSKIRKCPSLPRDSSEISELLRKCFIYLDLNYEVKCLCKYWMRLAATLWLGINGSSSVYYKDFY